MNLFVNITTDVAERFLSKVDRTGGSAACWPWTAATDRNGYGLFCIHGKQYRANRVAWFFAADTDPGDAQALHRCDNPSCCNPDHLFLGSNLDNVADKVAKQRQPIGERHRRSKLRVRDVLEIRTSTEPRIVVARRFGITKAQVKNIRLRKQWRHVS